MTTDLEKKKPTEADLRAAPRYEFGANKALKVDVRVQEQPAPLSGQIIDLSRGGAKIMLSTTVAINSEAGIEIKTTAGTIKSKAKVCWSRPSQDVWWIGVAFEVELPHSDFSILAANGFIERRRDERVPHQADMTARWELGSDPIPVKLVDVSSGGLKIDSPKPGQVGHRVLLETEKNPGMSIVAKIRWQKETEQGFHIGCHFLNKNGYRNLMQQVGVRRRVIPLPKLPSYTTGQLVALTVGVALVAFVGFLLADHEAANAVGAWLWNRDH